MINNKIKISGSRTSNIEIKVKTQIKRKADARHYFQESLGQGKHKKGKLLLKIIEL